MYKVTLAMLKPILLDILYSLFHEMSNVPEYANVPPIGEPHDSF